MPRFVPRQRKHKVRKRLEQDSGNVGLPNGNDSNAAEIFPGPVAETEKKRQDMRNILRAQHPKTSSKKQKRLDKYIVCRPSLCLSVSDKAKTNTHRT